MATALPGSSWIGEGCRTCITHVFLFDALYGQHEYFRDWLLKGKGIIRAAYTDHLAKEHADVAASVAAAGPRWSMTPAGVEHDKVPNTFFARWLSELPAEWKLTTKE